MGPKIKFIIRLFAFMTATCVGQHAIAQVGVNILTPHPTAALQVQSPAGSFKGVLTPSMTTINRMSVATGTIAPADGLIVYDTDHRMHYNYNAATNRWISLSPLTLSTPSVGSAAIPSGAITTPSSAATFSLGINKQNPTQALDVVGNSTVSGNTSIGGSLNVAGFPSNALVPAGTIVMFHGGTIPAGWAQCDGNSGTPDLRGRFIVAAGQSAGTPAPGDFNPNYSVNSTGGENRHVLTKAETPKHYHEANADGSTITANGGAHYHDVTPHGQGLNASRAGGNSGGLANDSQQTINTTSNLHSHPTSEFGGKVGNGTTDGLNDQAHENRPQYYVLIFIMKL
jgi:microcystin-dependent protein